jgi:sec-independent protein translocase protein TatA
MGDALAPWHIIILLIVVVILFGSRKLPDSARALGQAMRIFKAETKGLHTDDDPSAAQHPGATQAALTAQQATIQQPSLRPTTMPQQNLESAAPDATQQQIQDLQRQIQELQQKTSGGAASNGTPLAEAQPNQPSSF